MKPILAIRTSHTNKVFVPTARIFDFWEVAFALHLHEMQNETDKTLNFVTCHLALAHSENTGICRCSTVFHVEENFAIFSLLMILWKCDSFDFVI